MQKCSFNNCHANAARFSREIYEIFILISETFIKNLGLIYALFVRHSDNMIILECSAYYDGIFKMEYRIFFIDMVII